MEAAAFVSPFACVSSPGPTGTPGPFGQGPDVGLFRSASRGSLAAAAAPGQLQQGDRSCSQPQQPLLGKEKQMSLPVLSQQGNGGAGKDTIPAWHGDAASLKQQQQLHEGVGVQGGAIAAAAASDAAAGSRENAGCDAGSIDAGHFGAKEALWQGGKTSPNPLHLQPAASDDVRGGLDACQQYRQQPQQVADWGFEQQQQHSPHTPISPQPRSLHHWGSHQEQQMASPTCKDLSSSFQQMQLQQQQQQQQAVPLLQRPPISRSSFGGNTGGSAGAAGDAVGHPASSRKGGSASTSHPPAAAAAAGGADIGANLFHAAYSSATHRGYGGRASDSQLLVMAGGSPWCKQGGEAYIGMGQSPSLQGSIGHARREDLGQRSGGSAAGMQAAASLPLDVAYMGRELAPAAASGAGGVQADPALSSVTEHWALGGRCLEGGAMDGGSPSGAGGGAEAGMRQTAAAGAAAAVSNGTDTCPAVAGGGGRYADQEPLGHGPLDTTRQQQQQEVACKHMRMTRHSSISLEDLGLTPWLSPGGHHTASAAASANGHGNPSSSANNQQQRLWHGVNQQQVRTSDALSHLVGSPTHALLEASCSPFAALGASSGSQNWLQQYPEQPPGELSPHSASRNALESHMLMGPGSQGALFGMTRHSSLSLEQLHLGGGLDGNTGGVGAWQGGWGGAESGGLARGAMGSMQDLDGFKDFSFSLAAHQKSLISQPFQMPSFFLKEAQTPASPSGSLASSVTATGSCRTPEAAAGGGAEGGAQGLQEGSASLGNSPTGRELPQCRGQTVLAQARQQQQQQQAVRRALDLQGVAVQEQQLGGKSGALSTSAAAAIMSLGRAAAAAAGGGEGGAGARGDEGNGTDQERLPPGYGGVFHSIWGQ